MSWQEFKYVWGFEERPHQESIHHASDEYGIYEAGNFIYDDRKRNHESFVVELPVQEMDFDDKLYAQWLLDHPHPKVELLFTENDLWKQENKPIIVPVNYGEKSPIEMTEDEYQAWIDEKRGIIK